MGTAFQRRSALGIADQPELPPYSDPGPSIAMAAKPQGRRPGLFGRLGNALSRVDWERVAAAMRDDPSHMQMLMQQRENMAERARQEAEAEAERRVGKQQNADREAYLATLPQEQQLALRAGVQPQYQFSELQNIDGRLGQRDSNGRYYWAPQVPAGSNQIPSGYRPTVTGDLEAIPGGPADLRATEAGARRGDQLDSSIRALDNADAALNEAVGILDQGVGQTDLNPFNDATGVTGQIMRNVGGSRAYDFNQALEPVRAILSFETLAEMRRNSQTGGALGSIAVRELELLGNTVRSLDTAQSRPAVQRSLLAVRAQLRRTRQAVAAARAEMQGQAPEEAPQEERVRTFNPATGRLE